MTFPALVFATVLLMAGSSSQSGSSELTTSGYDPLVPAQFPMEFRVAVGSALVVRGHIYDGDIRLDYDSQKQAVFVNGDLLQSFAPRQVRAPRTEIERWLRAFQKEFQDRPDLASEQRLSEAVRTAGLRAETVSVDSYVLESPTTAAIKFAEREHPIFVSLESPREPNGDPEGSGRTLATMLVRGLSDSESPFLYLVSRDRRVLKVGEDAARTLDLIRRVSEGASIEELDLRRAGIYETEVQEIRLAQRTGRSGGDQ